LVFEKINAHSTHINCWYFKQNNNNIYFYILNSNSTLQFNIPTAKLLDDDEIHPLTVTFPSGRVIKGSSTGINDEIPCHLSFSSSKPVSFFANLLFCDDRNNW